MIAAGFDSVPKIIDMSEKDFLDVEGFKEKLAKKIHTSITDKVKKASLSELMHATNIFGRGFGKKRFESILSFVPNILISDKSESEKLELLLQVEGMARKSAEKFLLHLHEDKPFSAGHFGNVNIYSFVRL